MRLSTENLGPHERGEIAVGNVYAAKGGKASQRDDTKYRALEKRGDMTDSMPRFMSDFFRGFGR